MPKIAEATSVATDRIRAGIRDGRYRPGARLVERSLASELALSRIPVREALRTLVAEGFAVERATGGIAVREHAPADVADLHEVNAALEQILVRRLANDVERLGPLVDLLAETGRAIDDGRTEQAIAGNARFHSLLAELAAVPVVTEVLAGIGPRLAWLMGRHADPAPLHAEHVALVAALRAGDVATAVALVAAHATTGRAAALALQEADA